MAEDEDLPELPADAKESEITARNVEKNLIVWAKQLEVDGIPADVLTVDYLLNHLSGEDYAQLFDAQEQLRAKSTAATANQENPVAAASTETIAPATATTDKP